MLLDFRSATDVFPVSRELELDWNDRSTSSQQAALLWTTTARVTDSATVAWAVRLTVRPDDVDLLWRQRALVAETLEARFNVRALASGDVPLITWDVLTVAVARAGGRLLWSIRELVAREAELDWRALHLQARDLEVDWRLLELLPVDAALSWDTRELTDAEAYARWRALGLQGDETTLRWHTGVVPVDNSLSVVWTVTVPVSAALDAPWALRQLADRPSALVWSSAARTGSLLAAPWRVHRTAGWPAAARWAVLQGVSVERASRWSFTSSVSQALQLRWQLIGRVRHDVLLLWRPNPEGPPPTRTGLLIGDVFPTAGRDTWGVLLDRVVTAAATARSTSSGKPARATPVGAGVSRDVSQMASTRARTMRRTRGG